MASAEVLLSQIAQEGARIAPHLLTEAARLLDQVPTAGLGEQITQSVDWLYANWYQWIPGLAVVDGVVDTVVDVVKTNVAVDKYNKDLVERFRSGELKLSDASGNELQGVTEDQLPFKQGVDIASVDGLKAIGELVVRKTLVEGVEMATAIAAAKCVTTIPNDVAFQVIAGTGAALGGLYAALPDSLADLASGAVVKAAEGFIAVAQRTSARSQG